MRPSRPAGALALAAVLLPAGTAAQDLDVDGVGYLLGDPHAPVAVVEFADFACSACAEFWRDT